MINNESGQVAVAYYQPIPQTVKVDKSTYIFSIRAGVSMAWINPEHVHAVLSITKHCCGGSVHSAYRYATQGQVNVWSGKGR